MKKMNLPTVAALMTVAFAIPAEATWPWSSSTKTTTLPLSKTSGTPLINGTPIHKVASGPSTWDKFSASTKKVATGTVDVLTLKPLRDQWSSPSTKKTTPRVVPQTPKPSANSSSVFGSWFKPKKEEKKIKTVGEWMAQPMPKL